MKEATDVILAVGRAKGNDKLALLKKYENTPNLKAILKFIYNPYCKTGIAAARLSKAMTGWPTGAGARRVYLQDAIEYFSKHQTGTDYDVAIAREFIRTCEVDFGPDAMRLAMAIITQDLKIGVSVTSLNKVYGADFIPKTGCMLGTLYWDVNPATVAWPCIVTEKLDGIRRVLIKDNGTVTMYSRSGHQDDGLVEILAEAKHLPDNYVYDGELLAKGTFKDSIALRQATNSIANSKGKKTGLSFNVFDMLPIEEFYACKSKEGACKRKVRLGATFMDDSISLLSENWATLITAFGMYTELNCIKPVGILGYVNSLAEVEPIVSAIWSRGGEGVMLNTANGLYEIKRSKQLLKLKHTEEFVLPVVDILEGTGKYEDAMGALVIDYNGSLVGVGSGFTDDQRREIWNNGAKYIGRKIELECFGESTNAAGNKSLNCPIFLRFVGDEHE